MSKEFSFWKDIEDELDKQFPKGKCKERGNALVLFAIFNLKFKEFIKLLKFMGDLKDYEGYSDCEKFINKIDKLVGDLK